MNKPKKKPLSWTVVWRESRALLWEYRVTLAIGLSLTLVNRLASFVLPMGSKALIDTVIAQNRSDLLITIAAAVAGATLVQAGTSFAISQVVSLAGQRAITDMRRAIQSKVLHLPVSFFDATQSGVLISRVMSDAEGVRNLIGTGIVQLLGGLVSASIGIVWLFYLNWHLTTLVILLLAIFAGAMAFAFSKLRPIFRKRSEINAEITGRLSQTLSGARVVKAYTAEKREELVFTRGVHRLFRNIASTITGVSAVSAVSTVIVGSVGALIFRANPAKEAGSPITFSRTSRGMGPGGNWMNPTNSNPSSLSLRIKSASPWARESVPKMATRFMAPMICSPWRHCRGSRWRCSGSTSAPFPATIRNPTWDRPVCCLPVVPRSIPRTGIR
jgi:subfamily B ATP-binding cassette protein MsbA